MTGESEDAFFGGAVRVVQPAKGFRAGTDSVLLAAGLPDVGEGEALEIGCGSGAVLLMAAWREVAARLTGVDRDEDALGRARRGIALNRRAQGRVAVEHVSVAGLPHDWQNRFDLVFSNPPFFEPGRITPPPGAKRDAYLAEVRLEEWLTAMLVCARPKGWVVLVHRAAELARILSVLDRQAGEITVLPVRPHPGAEAKRVLVRARKGLRRGPMRLLAGLDLHETPGGARTDRLEAVAARGAPLDWA